jgi:hypothetical protein
MQLPRLLIGNAKAVAAACRKQVTRFVDGEPWIDPGIACIAARDAPGLILLNGPSPLLGGDDTVHAYAPFWELGKAIDSGRIALDTAARAFDEALGSSWSVLGLLSQANYRWLDDDDRAERFLAAMIHSWDELDAVGPRYTMGSRHGARLWELPHLLKYVLARQGGHAGGARSVVALRRARHACKRATLNSEGLS